ncbi:hypothetical protein MPH_06825 [Macrophomina phaseolina MS6]|uniref:Cation/H+ exchanger n=1 Tax=Macrophomina phaseolina (strain MS6) TaxID=1126212 RepID=K2RMV7_MACPH|nr:hypothetical protein MPH_06825 [Macrophomina phaseolina MS6]
MTLLAWSWSKSFPTLVGQFHHSLQPPSFGQFSSRWHLPFKPATVFLNKHREANPTGSVQKLLSLHQTTFIIHAVILFGFVAGGTYAGTSNLFTAYLAGASISWWDAEMPHLPAERPRSTDAAQNSRQSSAVMAPNDASQGSERAESVRSFSSTHLSGLAIYERYYHQAVEKILKPLFFASIGFSIPISQMFTGSVIWRGIAYTILMLFAKLVCGLWLVRFSISPYIPENLKLRKLRLPSMPHLWGASTEKKGKSARKKDQNRKHSHAGTTEPESSEQQIFQVQTSERSENETTDHHGSQPAQDANCNISAPTARHTSPDPKKPIALYPASIIGGAMVARGEIGFLISSIAESKGIFSSTSASASSNGPDDILLVVTWAIMLCRIIGPLTAGLLVRRVKKLQKKKKKKQDENAVEGRRDVLGVWGVE